MQQILLKKNSFNLDVDKRSSKTNQLTSESKVARITDAENFSLNTYEADFALKELLSFRADDSIGKSEMLRDIANEGYCRLADMTDDISNKQTINTVDVYFTGAGLVTDLLTPGLMFRRTLEERKKRSAAKEKYEESTNIDNEDETTYLSEDDAHIALKELFYKALQVGSDNKFLSKPLNEFSVSGVAQVATNQSPTINNSFYSGEEDIPFENEEDDIDFFKYDYLNNDE